jgi:regulator of sigma E protease
MWIYFAVALLGFVITIVVHELGHFLMARRAGVKVEVFSIGFGPRLLPWRDKHGTEWILAPLPLGGYVKMKGQEDLPPASPGARPDSFLAKALGLASIIVKCQPSAAEAVSRFIETHPGDRSTKSWSTARDEEVGVADPRPPGRIPLRGSKPLAVVDPIAGAPQRRRACSRAIGSCRWTGRDPRVGRHGRRLQSVPPGKPPVEVSRGGTNRVIPVAPAYNASEEKMSARRQAPRPKAGPAAARSPVAP